MAPEVIGKLVYGAGVDFWSCGVLFYECTVRKRLFNGNTREEMFRAITQSPIDITALQELCQPLSLLVFGLLNRQPNLRLGYNGIQEIKSHCYFDGVSWSTLSTDEAPFKPSLWQQPMKQNIEESKRLFYGDDYLVDSNSCTNSPQMESSTNAVRHTSEAILDGMFHGNDSYRNSQD